MSYENNYIYFEMRFKIINEYCMFKIKSWFVVYLYIVKCEKIFF